MYNPKLYVVSIAFLIALLLVSCHSSELNEKQLFRAQAIVENNPHQALSILDSISYPNRMSKDLYMQYVVAKVQAKYKCYQDIKEDSIILDASNYFDKNKDYRQAALAYFYTASYYRENDRKAYALSAYLKADRNVQKTKDSRLKGMIEHNIGELYYLNDSLDVSNEHLRRALIYFGDKKENLYFKEKTLNYIGHIYRKTNQLDSAYYYYNKTYSIARDIDDGFSQYISLNNIGLVLREKRKYKDAEQYFNKALPFARMAEDSVRLHLNLAKVYYHINNTELVDDCLSLVDAKISQIKSLEIFSSLYEFLAQYNNFRGHFKEASKYEKLKGEVNEKILLSKNANKLVEAKSEFNLSLKQKEIENEQFKLYLFSLIVAIVLCGILLIVRHLMHKTKIQRENNRLLEARNTVLEKEKSVLIESRKLLQDKVNSFVFLYILNRNIANEWLRVEREIDDLAKIYDCETRPQFFIRFEEMINNLKDSSEIQIVEWAKDYLKNHNVDIAVIDKLKIDDLLLLCLNYSQAEDSDIASILGIPLNRVTRKKTFLERKLTKIDIHRRVPLKRYRHKPQLV